MLGAVPGVPALGRGPAPDGDYSRHEYHHPAAGWGAARSVGKVIERAGEPLEGVRALFVMNHEDGGFDCPGCAWPDDPSGLRLDICENGVKHATWELAPAKADREFFAAHTVGELADWSDYYVPHDRARNDERAGADRRRPGAAAGRRQGGLRGRGERRGRS